MNSLCRCSIFLRSDISTVTPHTNRFPITSVLSRTTHIQKGQAFFSISAYRLRGDKLRIKSEHNKSRGDNNKNRGVSALRRTGPRKGHVHSVQRKDLPEPVLDKERRSEVKVDSEHGLWQFFPVNRRPLNTPEEDAAHGRPWSVEELRHKSWDNLHKLWWVCVKERNRIATSSRELDRLEAGFGETELTNRDKTINKTMFAIRHTLTERWYAYEEARMLYEEERLGKKDWRVKMFPGRYEHLAERTAEDDEARS